MRQTLTLTQTLSLQLSTAQALDRGLEEVHLLVAGHTDDSRAKELGRQISLLMLKANKKVHFRRGLPAHHFLRSDTLLLKQVIMYAMNRHHEEFRESGHSTLAHVLSVGFILARLGFPREIILSGILHDAVEDASDKIRVLNELFAIMPHLAWYVYSVSGPDIRDSVEKDRLLFQKIQSCSDQLGNIYPQAIKVADSIANLYDLQGMHAKDGRTARQRQQLFADKVHSQVLPFAHLIDKLEMIPISRHQERFSLYEYLEDCLMALQQN